ncbi:MULTISPECIES: hypothetical protein [unclassified Rhizobium]|uniref:hypothetical protein n=1 Tax=unclassified Rhizobium TaxID=2613769 RepID=UPI0012E30730|nr:MULTISPECIES: hypothetical protein [unclassified Rhizobium]
MTKPNEPEALTLIWSCASPLARNLNWIPVFTVADVGTPQVNNDRSHYPLSHGRSVFRRLSAFNLQCLLQTRFQQRRRSAGGCGSVIQLVAAQDKQLAGADKQAV